MFPIYAYGSTTPHFIVQVLLSRLRSIHTRTYIHTHIYIYIYERERERTVLMKKIDPETDGFTHSFRTPEQETLVFGMTPLYPYGCTCPLLTPEICDN
jgi:hypothetical protein